jgi:Tol biopolymer transport system component
VAFAFSVGLIVTVLAFGVRQDRVAEYSAVPLTSYQGSALCPSFSPEGERLAFSWDGEKGDNFDIYFKQIGLASLSRLTTDPRPDLSPAWSPDGRTIAYLRLTTQEKADLVLIPSTTHGPERRIAETTAHHELYSRVRFLSWSPDGKWIVAPDTLGGSGNVPGLCLISVRSGEKRRLTQPPAWNDDLSPAIAPDMRHLVFARYTGPGVSDLYAVDLSSELQPTGEPKRLTFYDQQTSSPAWTRNGRIVLFTRYSTRGSPSIWRMPFPISGHPEPVHISNDDARSLAVSSEGSRVVYARETENDGLWRIEMPGSPLWMARSAPCKPWITSSRQESTPQFSPDGQHVAFQSSRSGWSEIWIAERDGSHPRQLTNLKAAVAGFPHWSPDGTKIVFHVRERSQARLVVQDVQGGRPRSLTAGYGNDYSPSWSHDGGWIYFCSERSGGDQIWRISAEGGLATQITTHGGWDPTESPDGKFLFYTKYKQNGVWRIPLSGGKERQLVSNVAGLGSAYAVGRQGIYFVASPSGSIQQQLGFFNFAAEEVTWIAKVPRSLALGLAISPDERMLLYSQMDHLSSDLMLVEDFR